MATKTGKRPMRALTVQEKLVAIRRVHEGESKASVARDIGVPESTLRGWCKNEEKISYQSRQSSPETDESNEPKEKRAKIETSQPFNLSVRASSSAYAPNPSTLHTPVDYSSRGELVEATPKTSSQNLSIKNETTLKVAPSQMSEVERNRVELNRLSEMFGLNRPEMIPPNSSNSMKDVNNLTLYLLNQWNVVRNQAHQNQPRRASPDTTTNPPTPAHTSIKPPEAQQPPEDYVKAWVNNQDLTGQSQLSSSVTATTSSLIESISYQSALMTEWYKKNLQQFSPHEQAILYQQLTKNSTSPQTLNQKPSNQHNRMVTPPKDYNVEHSIVEDKSFRNNSSINNNNNDAENLTLNKVDVCELKTNIVKKRAVLDDLLSLSNRPHTNSTSDEDENRKGINNNDILSRKDAIEHGEKFLEWLDSCSDPSLTAMQINQFKTLLMNVKNGAHRRNGEFQQGKCKVKRK